MSATRRIFRSSSTSQAEIRELLQALIVAELLSPSRTLWLVSPWLSDLELLDNRTGAYAALDPQWEPRHFRLAELLGRLMELGTRVILATRPVEHSENFLRKLDDLVHSSGLHQQLTVHRRPTLHLKGLLGDDYYLSGSMNFTFSGVELNEESVILDASPEGISQAHIAFDNDFGDAR